MLTPDSLTDWDPLFFTRALHSPQPIILPDLASVLELKMFEIKKLKNDSRDLAQLKIASSWLLFFSLENDVLTTNMAIFSQFDGIWPLLTLCDLSFKINLYLMMVGCCFEGKKWDWNHYCIKMLKLRLILNKNNSNKYMAY